MSLFESLSTFLSGAQFLKSIIRSGEFKKLFVHIDAGDLEENANFFFNNLFRKLFDEDMQEVIKNGNCRKVLDGVSEENLDIQKRKKMYVCKLVLYLHEKKKDTLPQQLSINPQKLLEAIVEPLEGVYNNDKKMTEYEIYTKIVDGIAKNCANAFISILTILTTPGPAGTLLSEGFVELGMKKINEIFDYEPLDPSPPIVTLNPRKRKRENDTSTNKNDDDKKKPRN